MCYILLCYIILISFFLNKSLYFSTLHLQEYLYTILYENFQYKYSLDSSTINN